LTVFSLDLHTNDLTRNGGLFVSSFFRTLLGQEWYFVPGGQDDSSQARSAWSHLENSPVPAGRLKASRLRLDANIPFDRNT